MLAILTTLMKDEEGAQLVEYALLVTLIAIVCIAGARSLGNSVNSFFNTAAGSI
ncbi:MAG: Flp family type IVb pilin [Candidatus Cybelea sp.]